MGFRQQDRNHQKQKVGASVFHGSLLKMEIVMVKNKLNDFNRPK
jgi:hypothetical protein